MVLSSVPLYSTCSPVSIWGTVVHLEDCPPIRTQFEVPPPQHTHTHHQNKIPLYNLESQFYPQTDRITHTHSKISTSLHHFINGFLLRLLLLLLLPLHPLPPTRSPRVSLTRSEACTLPILSFEGAETGTLTLRLKSAPLETSRAVVHRGLITDMRNKRRGTASTLTRAEVRGGGKKPYPQKKTGRARRGSQTTPLRPGGGVVFGPKPKDWSVKINKKEKRLAISTALASALENAIVVEEFEENFEKPKTKEFIAMMKRLGLDPKEKSMFLMTEVNENVALSSRNIGTLKMLTPRTLNLFDILDSEKLVLTKGAVEFLNERYGYEYESEGDEEEEEEDEGIEDG